MWKVDVRVVIGAVLDLTGQSAPVVHMGGQEHPTLFLNGAEGGRQEENQKHQFLVESKLSDIFKNAVQVDILTGPS